MAFTPKKAKLKEKYAIDLIKNEPNYNLQAILLLSLSNRILARTAIKIKSDFGCKMNISVIHVRFLLHVYVQCLFERQVSIRNIELSDYQFNKTKKNKMEVLQDLVNSSLLTKINKVMFSVKSNEQTFECINILLHFVHQTLLTHPKSSDLTNHNNIELPVQNTLIANIV